MTYKKESYVLDTFKDIQETIRSPQFEQLIKETHEIILYYYKLLKLLILGLLIIIKKTIIILIEM